MIWIIVTRSISFVKPLFLEWYWNNLPLQRALSDPYLIYDLLTFFPRLKQSKKFRMNLDRLARNSVGFFSSSSNYQNVRQPIGSFTRPTHQPFQSNSWNWLDVIHQWNCVYKRRDSSSSMNELVNKNQYVYF